ncbi:MAG: hypothetical protein F6K00_19590 [Leptolyngbya sp. SIOISBB]|nr:hypothetical protein [Leptolyngbya sp. SIOISBB]
MAAVSAVNPNLASADAETRRADMLDTLLLLRDIADGAETSDVAETAVALEVEKLSMAAIKIDGSCAGTVDGSNFWTLTINVADNVGMSDPTAIHTQVLPASFDYYVPIDGKQIEAIRTAGQDESLYIQASIAETGTTATSCTYGAYVTSQC